MGQITNSKIPITYHLESVDSILRSLHIVLVIIISPFPRIKSFRESVNYFKYRMNERGCTAERLTIGSSIRGVGGEGRG